MPLTGSPANRLGKLSCAHLAKDVCYAASFLNRFTGFGVSVGPGDWFGYFCVKARWDNVETAALAIGHRHEHRSGGSCSSRRDHSELGATSAQVVL